MALPARRSQSRTTTPTALYLQANFARFHEILHSLVLRTTSTCTITTTRKTLGKRHTPYEATESQRLYIILRLNAQAYLGEDTLIEVEELNEHGKPFKFNLLLIEDDLVE